MRDKLLCRVHDLIEGPLCESMSETRIAELGIDDLLFELQEQIERGALVIQSAKHAVEMADEMLVIIMRCVHGREPARLEPPPMIASEEPLAQPVIEAVKEIFEHFAATDLQDCLLEVHETLQVKARRVLDRLNSGEDLTGPTGLLQDLTDVLERAANGG